MRISAFARAAGTTVRTIRYYEEIGLLPPVGDRAAGAHRVYSDDDVTRLREVLRLRDLLGLSLDELGEMGAAEGARVALRSEFWEPGTSKRRRKAILDAFEEIVARQRALLDRRRAQLDELEAELADRERRIAQRRAEL
jgi:DNA-binding transcriptional MerR regulator